MFTPWLVPSVISPEPFTGRLGGGLHAGTHGLRAGLIGLDVELADQVRTHLFAHEWDFGDLAFGDLGNLRKPTAEVAIPLLRELLQAGIIPLLIGGSERLVPVQYQAFTELNREIGLFVIDQYISLNPGVLDDAVYRERLPAYRLMHAGSQRHLVSAEVRDLFAACHYELTGLGRARAEVRDLEPPIRDAEVMTVHIGSLARHEAPAQPGLNASGLSLLEAGQLVYYAGASDRLQSFGLFGYEPAAATVADRTLTAAAYAQLAWYFLHGLSQRVGDFPVTSEGLVAYVTHTAEVGRLTFWKSPLTGRWWLELPAAQRLLACSEADYQRTVEGAGLSERLLTVLSRY
jgi:hypothetical protein